MASYFDDADCCIWNLIAGFIAITHERMRRLEDFHKTVGNASMERWSIAM